MCVSKPEQQAGAKEGRGWAVRSVQPWSGCLFLFSAVPPALCPNLPEGQWQVNSLVCVLQEMEEADRFPGLGQHGAEKGWWLRAARQGDLSGRSSARSGPQSKWGRGHCQCQESSDGAMGAGLDFPQL